MKKIYRLFAIAQFAVLVMTPAFAVVQRMATEISPQEMQDATVLRKLEMRHQFDAFFAQPIMAQDDDNLSFLPPASNPIRLPLLPMRNYGSHIISYIIDSYGRSTPIRIYVEYGVESWKYSPVDGKGHPLNDNQNIEENAEPMDDSKDLLKK